MLRWYPSALLRVVLWITFAPLLFFSIFAVNCLCDPTTPWRAGPWHGPGATADFWQLLGVLAFGWTVLALGWRGAGRAFRVSVLIWHLGLSTACARFVVAGDVVVQGASVGLTVSLRLLGPALCVIALGGTLVWLVLDARRGARVRSVSPLQRRNKIAAGIAVGLLALGAVAFGVDAEEIGVVACALGFVACHEVIRPLNPSEELRKAFLLEGSAPL
ncbi:MAG: hypothetical protein AAF628_17580 [Planctomycetota bacterium]